MITANLFLTGVANITESGIIYLELSIEFSCPGGGVMDHILQWILNLN